MTVAELNKKDCMGCKMCKDVCPVHAISFNADQTGFWYPNVDEAVCIKCGKCEAVCEKPQLSGGGEPVIGYQVWLKDETMRLKSTSGGAYYAAAKAVLEEGGVLAGCAYTKDFRSAKHILAENDDGLHAIMGNKYFQSDTEGIYEQIKSAADSGKQVLFCGTPCQCAAVRKYLGKEDCQIFLIELICSGINSPKAYTAFLDELEMVYGASVSKVHQRNKKTGWANLGTCVEFANGEVYQRDIGNDAWMNGFAADKLYIRPSCFTCRYKERKRAGDITIGDFWGVQNATKKNMFLGISAVTVNTEKGRLLFEKMKKRLEYQRCAVHRITRGNPAYFGAVEKRYRTEEFFEQLEQASFSNVVGAMIGKNLTIKKKRFR